MTHEKTLEALNRVLVVSWLYWLLLPMQRLFLSLFFGSIVIRGAQHLPTQGPVVLAPKYYSRWYPIVPIVIRYDPARV